MMRIYKLYDLPFTIDGATERLPATRSSFPAYPGSLFSADDFYVQNSGLIIWETTIGFNNTDLNKYVVPEAVSEWIRQIVANRLAYSGESWIKAYSRYNSGTYNNANQIFNLNLFSPGKPLVEGTFWLSEQIPGYIRNHDLTHMLESDRYYGSCASDSFVIAPHLTARR